MNDHHPGSGNRTGGQNPAYALLQPLVFSAFIIFPVETSYQVIWQQLLPRISRDWRALPDPEKAELRSRVRRIADLQQQMHQLFLAAEGLRVCTDCRGECCGSGTHHLTLANLLALLDAEHPFPHPDFNQSCPWLGADGCRLEPGCRPFNCITFVCHLVEEVWSPAQLASFYRLERELRGEYQLLARRYAGASLQGVLLAARRLGPVSLLSPIRSKP